MNTSQPTATWTIGQLLDWTTEYLRQHGSASARLDAEVLLAHARQCSRIDLYTSFKDVADDALRGRFRELVRRRSEGTPVAYLVGHREFYSTLFEVSPAVLIPRPETEFVLTTLFDLVKQTGDATRPLAVADVGTGSGNLACCIAARLPQARVTAVDNSPAALEVASRNVHRHGLGDRVQLVESDLFAHVPVEQWFDFIVSNPPYIGLHERDSLPADVIDHEPHDALFAGPTGREVLERLIEESKSRLRPGGWLICEISPIIAEPAMQHLSSAEGYQMARLINDLANQARVIAAQRTTGS